MARRMGRRLSLLLVVAGMPLALWAVLPLGSSGQSADSLQRQIERKRAQIDQKKGRERVLTTEVSAYTRKIGGLQADITQLQTRQIRLEADLEAKRAELAQIQEDLRRERLHLARLRRRLAEARVELANRLVAHSRKSAATCRIRCMLHNEGRCAGTDPGGRLAWPAAWVVDSASCSWWRRCRSRSGLRCR